MKIILDFDDTIFNTHRLAKESVVIFEKFGFTEKEFWDAYQKCKKIKGDFDLDMVVDLVFNSNKSNYPNTEDCLIDKNKIKKEMNFLFLKASEFIYPDLFDFVKKFNGKDLILLSFGEINFQGMKIENSKITSFFSETIITQKNKVEDLKLICEKYGDEKIFFIDDKAEQIDKIKESLPQIITMKMERPQGSHINTKSELTDYVVKNLDEAKEIILEK